MRSLSFLAMGLATLAAASTAHAQTNFQIAGCPLTPTTGTTCIDGGGAQGTAQFYDAAWQQYINANPQYGFSFAGSGSLTGDLAFANNDSTLWSFSKTTRYAVEFSATDNIASAVPDTVVSGTSYKGLVNYIGAGNPLPAGGQFIQISGFFTPAVVLLKHPKVTGNNSLILTDDDLCGIFSGKLTNWSQTSAGRKLSGPVRVYYRVDGAGTTFLLTQHLRSACTTGPNGNSNITFFTTAGNFAAEFPNGQPPANFVGRTTSQGIADAVNTDTSNSGQPSAIGYAPPAYSAIVAVPATQGAGNPPYTQLYVSGVRNRLSNRSYLPNVSGMQVALRNPGPSATNVRPPASRPLAQVQTNWVPTIADPADGYPILGPSNLDLATCYTDTNVAAGLTGWLTELYNGTFNALLNSNGLVQMASLATSYGGAVYKTFLTNGRQSDGSRWNLNINGPSCTASVPRR